MTTGKLLHVQSRGKVDSDPVPMRSIWAPRHDRKLTAAQRVR